MLDEETLNGLFLSATNRSRSQDSQKGRGCRKQVPCVPTVPKTGARALSNLQFDHPR